MNTFGAGLVTNFASAVSALAAAYLAYHDKDGWGWFLLAAVILHSSVEWSERQ